MSVPQIMFRVDASPEIGMGHAIRCLSLADALKSKGCPVAFVMRACPEFVSNRVGEHGIQLYSLEGDFSAAGDVLQTRNIIDSCAGETWLVVDHHGLGASWEKGIRGGCAGLIAIDDHARNDHDCDILIDQNFGADDEDVYPGRVPTDCLQLLGPRYALLAPDYAHHHSREVAGGESVRRILVNLGGGDTGKLYRETIEALSGLHGLEIDVVANSSTPGLSWLESACAERPNFSLHVDVPGMADLLVKADLAIGSGGASNWERLCLGVPAILVNVAENQVQPNQRLAEGGYALCLGSAESVDAELLRGAVLALAADGGNRSRMARAGAQLVDGRGAERVAAEILAPRVSLREAGPEDSDRILEWRNAGETRRRALDSKVIEPGDHARWYRAKLGDPDCEFLVAEVTGEAVGVLRYDCSGDVATVSIFLAPGDYGHGVGTRVLRAGSAWLGAHRPELRHVLAEILEDNVASIRAFEKAGYERWSRRYRLNLGAVGGAEK